MRFVGVHTGHLGFYTDYLDSEIDKLVENLKYDTGAKVSYPILNVKITFDNGETRTMRALNEATIKRSDRTMVADLTINGVDFERFRGDGITTNFDLTGSTEVPVSTNRTWVLKGAVLHSDNLFLPNVAKVEIATIRDRQFSTTVFLIRTCLSWVSKEPLSYCPYVGNAIYLWIRSNIPATRPMDQPLDILFTFSLLVIQLIPIATNFVKAKGVEYQSLAWTTINMAVPLHARLDKQLQSKAVKRYYTLVKSAGSLICGEIIARLRVMKIQLSPHKVAKIGSMLILATRLFNLLMIFT